MLVCNYATTWNMIYQRKSPTKKNNPLVRRRLPRRKKNAQRMKDNCLHHLNARISFFTNRYALFSLQYMLLILMKWFNFSGMLCRCVIKWIMRNKMWINLWNCEYFYFTSNLWQKCFLWHQLYSVCLYQYHLLYCYTYSLLIILQFNSFLNIQFEHKIDKNRMPTNNREIIFEHF